MMPIPVFTGDGLLPPGVHDATLGELKERFGRVQRSEIRVRLMEHLEGYVEEVRKAGVGLELLVDGSFVTSKDEPGDVDCVLILDPNVKIQSVLSPAKYNVISKRMVRRRHGIDLFAVPADSASVKTWTGFFGQVRGLPGQTKGLVRILL